MREHGIQTIEKARRQTVRPVCNSNSQNFESVRIIDCYAAFLVLCYGLAVAFILLCIEFICKSKCICVKRCYN